MKARYDFVSNSSSSSFIVDHESNRFMMYLDAKDMKRMSLSQYLDMFGERELNLDSYLTKPQYYKIYENREMTFMSQQAFANLFPISLDGVLPETARKDWTALCRAVKAQDEYHDRYYQMKQDESHKNHIKTIDLSYMNQAEWKKLHEAEQDARKAILKKVMLALQPIYGKMVFDYAEIDDSDFHASYSDEEDAADEPFESEEDRVRSKYLLLSQHFPVKFWRVFSNH